MSDDSIIKDTRIALIVFLPILVVVTVYVASVYLQLIHFPSFGPAAFRKRLWSWQVLLQASTFKLCAPMNSLSC